ncbi:MAG: SpoIIE family protein phosphatase [Phycisphaerales bacterium]
MSDGAPREHDRQNPPGARGYAPLMRWGIRRKLMLGIGAPLLVLAAMSVLLDFRVQRKEALRRTEAYLSKESQYHAARFETQLQLLAQVARSTALFLDTHPIVPEAELYEILRRNVGQSPLIYGSCIAFEPLSFDPGRRLFAPYVYKGVGSEPGRGADGLLRMDVADAYDYTEPKWEWFNGPRNSGKAMWTEPFFDEGAGNVIMCTYVAPFFRDGTFRGTVNIDVKLEDLQEFAGTMHSGDVWTMILSRRGTLVSWRDPQLIMHETAASLGERLGRPDFADLGRRMTSGRTATERILSPDAARAPVLISYTPIRSTGWSFGTLVDEASVMGPVYLQTRQRAMIALGLSVAVVGIILSIGVWLTRPIERLAEAVRVLGSGGLDAPRVAARGRDEIGDLGRAFNTMVGRLRAQVETLTHETRALESVESELRIARDIQRSLLPRVFPPFPERREFDLHAFNGAARRVAGDFYDFFFLPDGRLALIIADVCGKGVPAALFMAVARTVVRNLALNGHSPASLLDEANRTLEVENTRGLFLTLIVAFFEPSTGRMIYANGGHPRPYVLSADGGVRQFGKVTGTVVGVLGDQSWEEAEESLAPGDMVVMFTDGVPDARRPGGPMFGEERLAELLASLPGSPAAKVCDRIIEQLDDFATRDWPDDVTLLVLKRSV